MNSSSDVPIASPETISRFKKEKYLISLTEDDFRDKAIRPLLLRIGYKDGRDVCGPSEKGKDAIFVDTDRLETMHLVAVQTKKGNLNLSRKINQNIVEAIIQLKTALETKIPLLISRKKETPSKVILVVSGKINENAKHHIVEEIVDKRIQFLDADELIPLIDKHYQEFWLGIDVALMPYFKAIKRLVDGETSIIGRDETAGPALMIGASSDKGYVPLVLMRWKIVTKSLRGKTERSHNIEEVEVQQLLKHKARRVILEGDAGAGKSTAMLRLANLAVTMGIHSGDDYLIPILLRATNIVRDAHANLMNICSSASKELANSSHPCFTVDDAKAGRLLVMVDGLDEVYADSEKDLIISKINEFCGEYAESIIILTSRPTSYISTSPLLKPFERYRILPLSLKQAQRLIKIVQRGKSLPASVSAELIRRIDQVHGIELNPLLVTVFAATAEYSRQDIPANITELFKKFTELMLGRWDETKGLRQQYQAPLKDFLLQKIAFVMHESRKTRMHVSDFQRIIGAELEKRGHSPDTDQILFELLKRSGLFRERGGEVEFRHHLLQEFFAGRGIQSEEFVKKVVTDEWWRRAIVFYFGESPQSAEKLRSQLTDRHTDSERDLYEAAATVGLALQACYLSEVETKLEVWKQVATTFAVTRAGILNETAKSGAPLFGFIYYYLYGRDSAALSNLSQQMSELIAWSEQDGLTDHSESEAKKFWLIIGLIETGEIEKASSLIDTFAPRDHRYLLAIHLGCYMLKELRLSSRTAKKCAQDICKHLEPRVAVYRTQLLKEFESELLEIRNDKVTAIEAHEKVTGEEADLT